MYPEITIFSLKLPTYLLVLSVVYCLMIFYFLKRLRLYKQDINLGIDLLLYVMLAGFVGARLFYVFYVNPQFYWNQPVEILRFWQGGFVFFGGFLMALFVGLIFLKRQKQDLAPWLNLSAPVGALGYGLGRLACFLNGCCYGSHCDLPWAVKYPHLEGLRHPSQVYAIVFEVLVWLGLIFLEKKLGFKKLKQTATLFYAWLCLHALGRLIMEHFRDDPRGQDILGLSVSTFISGILLMVGLILVSGLFDRFIQKTRTTHK